MTELDKARNIRKGEELDQALLQEYLNSHFPQWGKIDHIEQFPSGFSNLTYLLCLESSEVILRKPPIGANIKGGHDMHREYNVQSKLRPKFSKVPEVYAYSDDATIIGSEFYLMERVEGVIIRGKDPGITDPAVFNQISDSWLSTLIELHKVPYEECGLGDLGNPIGYNKRQIQGWTKRYAKSQTSDVKAIEKIMAWLNKSIPSESGHSLIHNDFKYDNVIYELGDWTKVKAVLDWEMSTLGDPLFDFGTSLAYWTEEEDLQFFGDLISMPTFQGGNLTRNELVELYAERAGADVSNVIYAFVYGLFKIAVIVQQIYYRYHHGITQDPRFKYLNRAAEMFCIKGLSAIQKNRIDHLF